MKLTVAKNGQVNLTVNGRRVGVTIFSGPWVAGVNPNLIKVRPKRGYFPDEIKSALMVENNSDSVTDYFEVDTIRLLPGHKLYRAAKGATSEQ